MNLVSEGFFSCFSARAGSKPIQAGRKEGIRDPPPNKYLSKLKYNNEVEERSNRDLARHRAVGPANFTLYIALDYSTAPRIPPARYCREAVLIVRCVGGSGGVWQQETKRQTDVRRGGGGRLPDDRRRRRRRRSRRRRWRRRRTMRTTRTRKRTRREDEQHEAKRQRDG